MLKYIVGAVSVVVLLIIVFFAVIRNDDKPETKNGVQTMKLVDYANAGGVVTLHTDGKLVGEEARRAIRITVSANERRIDILSGYNNDIISTQSFPNTTAAYSVFLSGLSGQGFTSKKTTNVTNPQSICTNGQHYYYTLSQGSEKKSDLWSVSCSRTGTFAGNGQGTRDLFQKQIPEYSKLVQGVTL